MYSNIFLILVLSFSFILFVGCHCLFSYRQGVVQSPWRVLFHSFLIGFVALLLLSVYIAILFQFTVADQIGLLLLNIFCYSALAFGYFNFINLMYTSLRVQFLKEFLLENHGLKIANLCRNYDAKHILSQRLLRLVKTGNLIYQENCYRLGKKNFFSYLGLLLKAFKYLLLKKKYRN